MASETKRVVTVADEAGTRALAGVVASIAHPRDVITLSGALGAGKTAFARAFIAAKGGDGEVPSPTFTLVQTYDTPEGTIYHFDLYRLDDPEDVYEIGIEDAFAEGISLIEWPDRLGRYLPRERLDIVLHQAAGETGRQIELTASPAWTQRLNEANLNDRP